MHWPVAFKYVPYDQGQRGYHESYDPNGCTELEEVKAAAHPGKAKVRGRSRQLLSVVVSHCQSLSVATSCVCSTPALYKCLRLSLMLCCRFQLDTTVSIRETWEAMEACVQAGLVKHIGLSNVPAIIAHDVMSYATIKPAMIQNEMHPYCQQNNLVAYAKDQGIVMTAYSPLGTGIKRLGSLAARAVLGPGLRGFSVHSVHTGCLARGSLQLSRSLTHRCCTASNLSWTGGDVLLQDEVLVAIGKKHGKSAAQVSKGSTSLLQHLPCSQLYLGLAVG